MSTDLMDQGAPPSITAYQHLLVAAKSVNLNEEWLKGKLSEKGTLVDEAFGELMLVNPSWSAFHHAGEEMHKIAASVIEDPPLLVEYKQIKAMALECGLTASDVLTHWVATADPAKPSKITPGRIKDFNQRIEFLITDQGDRQFAREVYGLEFPPAKNMTDSVDSAVSWRRISSGWKVGADNSKCVHCPLRIEGVDHAPINIASDNTDVSSPEPNRAEQTVEEAREADRVSGAATDNDDSGKEQTEDRSWRASGETTAEDAMQRASESATIPSRDNAADAGEAEAAKDGDVEISPCIKYATLQQKWSSDHNKEQFDWLWFDFFQEDAEITDNYLEAFDIYLTKLKEHGGKASLPAVVETSQVARTEPGSFLPTFEEAEYRTKKIAEAQSGMSNCLEMLAQRVHEGAQALKEFAQEGFGVIRPIAEAGLERYKKDTVKRDGTGEIAHFKGELKGKTFKGFPDADICFKKTGGKKIPKQPELDRWASMKCFAITDLLQETANQWMEEKAPAIIKAVARIKIEVKVDKEAVKANLENFDFPGVVIEQEHELGAMFVGKNGRPRSYTKEIKKLKASLRELIAACCDLEEEGDDDEGENEGEV